jgi:ubiquinone/menaquinone biosynthesis C-methylase UbiE
MHSPEKETNPWLLIPAADYERHMADPEVGQHDFLNDVIKDVLKRHPPKKMLVAGCATGNGFEHIDYNTVEKVVAIDINPEYIEILRRRFVKHLDKIETICSDINECGFHGAAFDLIHCALIFEYLDPEKTLGRLRRWLARDGWMSVVLQMPDPASPLVTDTAYKSLRRLEGFMRLLDPEDLNMIAAANGLNIQESRTCRLLSGKKFYTALYS